MKRIVFTIVLSSFVLLSAPHAVQAQGVGVHAPRLFIPSELMSFFVTSDRLGMAGTWVAWTERTHTAKGWLRAPVRAIVRGEPISARRPDLASQPSTHAIESGMVLGSTPGALSVGR